MVNWYKFNQRRTLKETWDDNHKNPANYLEVAHPRNLPKKYWENDIILWMYKNDKIYTKILQRSSDTHSELGMWGSISGRISLRNQIISIDHTYKDIPEQTIDAVLKLEEQIPEIKNFRVFENKSGKVFSLPVYIQNLTNQIKNKSLTVAQTNEELMQQYSDNINQTGVSITGTGQSEVISLPNGMNINAGDLLRQALTKIQNILINNGVREIDTSPLYAHPQAQGLAISHEPGKIHIDMQKIVNQVKQALPPVTQLDGTHVDNDLVDQISLHILGEIGETLSHESQHVADYEQALQQGNPFSTVQESPAEQFGRGIRNQYFSV